ncbi:tetratricopeptide repeat protein [Alcaligenes sp. SDU_A2]|uniref:tetratricopeptide repeat protein n=1 Tax=Alcaligenes sp. SDU_A2 TaxID=3136634 RepID=UPI00311DB986
MAATQGAIAQPHPPAQVAPAPTAADSRVNDPLLDLPREQERGWKGLARALDVLSPGVDTSVPLGAAEISKRINRLIAQGRYDDALQAIENRLKQRESSGEPGADVQLLFLKARALSGSGQHNKAIRIYQDMTTYYPELPEPWNNLAAEYIAQDKLDMALEALKMALTADPSYALARNNMGEVQLMLANDAYRKAASEGVSNAAQRAEQTSRILQQ